MRLLAVMYKPLQDLFQATVLKNYLTSAFCIAAFITQIIKETNLLYDVPD